ncbi:ribosomal protection-like ABC-F family protein [Lysinibacillus fusiformis]|uniref:ribosomal protection-like ABC-F family protein n=1 Tax=Lysinibacillus fusiformis TaxID=28031 RepID=UPI000880624A|nr:ABC-F type ribosomal protection protein [Lysinibacillus fusiformis]SCX50846.1 macrolide transport system ATP-binding/permease protein [Lysinibacillus fusiformis]SDB23477.1 macrolide transport system ATP-binding/permease protein [Lysinibacillus fusiformis]SFI13570.1 macrolide transport system ATP-binding/permease protein [Lysinibacillus fusiformis]SFS65960.1 macrolide transport system ATP-binding/permease protein [Lysinibacillus fusiformis]
MKELLKLQDISYEIKDTFLFEHVTATVKQGEVIGIIGRNGAGKSTLLQFIRGMLVPTAGEIKGLQTVKMAIVEQELAHFNRMEITAREADLLSKWKVPNVPFAALSGGEKLKMRLAEGFSQGAQILMLDEPTNHLDEQSTTFLIKQVQNYKGTIIVVSHDRYFLDSVATKIWSIEDKRLIEHNGNYSNYMAEREHRRLTQQRAYDKQQKNIERIEAQMQELTAWSQKGHAQSTKLEGFKEYHRVKAKRLDSQVKSKKKRLEAELEKAKVEAVKPESEIRFSLGTNQRVGKRFLETKNVSLLFDDRLLFNDVNITAQFGDKIAITGTNGSGKTSFLKVILGQLKAEGEVWVSPAANIGYLTQEVFDLPLDQTPEQYFYQETFEERGKVRNLMKNLGFTSTHWTSSIGEMSMGERVKCKLMAYIVADKNVLILDEPTNHLDLPSREQLEQTLAQYNGTLLVVSHDRYFLDKVTNSVWEVHGQQIEKKWRKEVKQDEDVMTLRLKLETERQEILGKLSFLTAKDKDYAKLDEKFNELTKRINELK